LLVVCRARARGKQVSESYYRHSRVLLEWLARHGHPVADLDGGTYLSASKLARLRQLGRAPGIRTICEARPQPSTQRRTP
jgi:hypothetical protein